ncbi:redoxin domain-containing protein [uncultured Parasphingorhabdus sp.]|uniref:peroxiredoxin n=1 Tax=uncultured Parasphingorhabdus sp. TaxID=2709694 RepID=UPI002AA65F8D|nr:redoxin domain-containing protein [uncultured Parasphingorhabdus sp.]
MKKWIVILLAVAIIGGSAFVYNTRSANAEPLEIGATAPDFTTTGALAGEAFAFSLSDKLKNGPVVLYFFPKVFTEGCTIEANMFAEATADFNAAGATVIGMSGDDIEGLKKFSVSECRNKFAVARADEKIINGYQVRMAPGLAMTNRTSYVIDRQGKIVFVHSATKPHGHVAGTLEKVKALSES